MKKTLQSISLLILFLLTYISSNAQVVIDNVTYSQQNSPPFTMNASGSVPPCGASTGTLNFSFLTNSLPANTVFTIRAVNSLGFSQVNTITTSSNGQLISQNYSGLAGSQSGVFYTILVSTPKIPPTFNDSSYVAVLNLRVISSINFAASVTPVNPLCPVPPNRGSASVAVSSGTAPFTYNWSVAPNATPGNAPSAPNLVPGNYSVYVRDVNGCDTTMTFPITIRNPIVSLNATPNPICQDAFPPNRTVVWTATLDTIWPLRADNLSYSWNGGVTWEPATTRSLLVTSFGTYSRSVIFRDANGCLSNTAVEVVIADSRPQVTAIANPPQVCPGTTSNITATILSCSSIGASCVIDFGDDSGVNPFYTTRPINRDTTVIVRVTNASGCVSNPFPVTIDTSGRPRIIPVVSPAQICPNGAYSITASCANNCTGVELNFNLNGFIAGSPQTYNQPTAPLVASTTSFPLRARAANGCFFDTTVTVRVFDNTLVVSAPPAPICANNNGSTATLTASGFLPESSLLWSTAPGGFPGDGASTPSITVGIPTATSVTYTVAGTDLNNCPRTAQQTVVANPQPVAAIAGPSVHCEGTTSSLTSSGGVSYRWFNASFSTQLSTGASFSVAPLVATSYGVIVTDANGCIDSTTYVLPFQLRPSGSVSANPTVICSGNTSDITLTANVPFTPNAAGGFSVTGGIAYSGTVGTSLVFPSVGPFSITANLDTRLRDNFGCVSLPIPITITVNPFTFSAVASNPTCSYSTNGSIAINAVSGGTSPNGLTYSVNGGASVPFTVPTTISNLPNASYNVVVRDGSLPACSNDTSITIVTPAPLSITSTGFTNVRCFGETNGTASVNVTGGTSNFTYFLNTTGNLVVAASTNRTPTYINLGPASYDLIVQDGLGCLDTVYAVVIAGPPSALVAPSVPTPSFCFGTTTGVFTMSPAATGGWGGYTYNFNGSSVALNGTVSGLGNGTYPLTVRDLNNCQVSTSVTFTSSPQLFSNAITTPSDCGTNGAITFLTATGGTPVPSYTYSLDGVSFGALPAPLNPVLVNTTATLYVRDGQGCIQDTIVTVLNIPRGIPNVSIVPPTCPGGNDGSITIDSITTKIPAATLYQYELFTDAQPRVLVSTGGPTAFNVAVPFANLLGGHFILQMTDGVCTNYAVDSFRVYSSPSVYQVVTTSAPINSGFADFFLPLPAGFTASSIALASDLNETTGTIVVYNFTGGTPFSLGGRPAYDMSLDNPTAFVTTALRDTLLGQTYVSYSGLAPGTHYLFIRDSRGCSDTLELIVPIKLFIPTLVTPNSDALNDYFEVVSLPEKSQMRIFNRWGDRVFESSNYDNKYNFNNVADGIYYYDLELVTGVRFKGWVQVVR